MSTLGLIFLIIVGVVVLVALAGLIALVVVLSRTRRQQKFNEQDPTA